MVWSKQGLLPSSVIRQAARRMFRVYLKLLLTALLNTVKNQPGLSSSLSFNPYT